MHYGGYAFARNRSLPTITNKDGGPVQPNENGFTEVSYLSYITGSRILVLRFLKLHFSLLLLFAFKTDILELNRLYNCTKDQTTRTLNLRPADSDEFHLKETNTGQVILANDCDFVGQQDFIQELSSSEECSELCIAKTWCTKFSWRFRSYCHLKIGLAVAYEHEGAVCGWIVKRTEASHTKGRADQSLPTEKQEKEHKKSPLFLKRTFIRAPLNSSLLSAERHREGPRRFHSNAVFN